MVVREGGAKDFAMGLGIWNFELEYRVPLEIKMEERKKETHEFDFQIFFISENYYKVILFISLLEQYYIPEINASVTDVCHVLISTQIIIKISNS